MRTLNHNWNRLGALLAGLLAAGVGWACNVPVFRYALERWTPDTYEVVVFHREPLAAGQKALVEALDKVARDGLANFTVETVNVGAAMSDPLQALWQRQSNAALPRLVVKYPSAKEITENAWEGPLTQEAVRLVLDSPARRELVKRLGQGTTAVWLLLEPAGAPRNDALVAKLEEQSRKLEKTLKLPERDPDDPPMKSDVPLKIAFSTLRVSRADPAEQGLVNLLLRPDKDLMATNEPMVFPVFGRGRAVGPLMGAQLEPSVLEQVAEFVAGPCSCQVKEMNPGLDLLAVADWDGILGDGRVVKEPELPALIGLSQFAAAAKAAATNPAVADPVPARAASVTGTVAMATNGAGASHATNAARTPLGGGSLACNLLFVFGVGTVFLIVATFAIRARFRPPPK